MTQLLDTHGLRCKSCGDSILVPGEPTSVKETVTLKEYLQRKEKELTPNHLGELSALRLYLKTHGPQWGCVVEYVTYKAVRGSSAFTDTTEL